MGRLWAYLASVAVSIALLSGCGGSSHRSFTFSRSTRPELALPAWERASLPIARAAERIADSDATLTRLVRLGDGKRLANVGTWAVGNKTRGGAEVVFKLKRPIMLNSDLPYVATPPDGPAHGTCVTPYALGWEHLSASGVTELSVLVDLGRSRVVEVDTNAKRGRVSPVAGKPYPACDEDQSG